MFDSMDTVSLPSFEELTTLDPADLEAVLVEVEQVRRRVEVVLAEGTALAERCRVHRADGHRGITAWGRATYAWSPAEALRITRNGAALQSLPAVRAMAWGGLIGVAQLSEFGRVFANPRCQDALTTAEGALADDARHRPFVDFRDLLRRWEALADADGAHREHTDARQQRHATVAIVGSQVVVLAEGDVEAGLELREIFERFCQAEFTADWEAATASADGRDVCVADLARTANQRRFDALAAIFRTAASAPLHGRQADPLVNLMVDLRTAEELLRRAAGDDVPPPDPDDYETRRCESVDGVPVDPDTMLAALLTGAIRRVVTDDAGVVIDLGRRSRLFRGGAREAVRLAERRCLWPGCGLHAGRCQLDHTHPWSGSQGSTSPHNGGLACGRHNRHKHHGYTVRRDEHGVWHTYRPDGTEIGAAVLAAHPTLSP
jgi:hypothetical protein